MLKFVLPALALLAVVYVCFLREQVFKTRFPRFFAWVEPIERNLWDKSRTMLFARLYEAAGYLLMAQGFLEEAGLTDVMSLIPSTGDPVKDKWIGVGVAVTGLLFSRLRKITAVPLEQNSTKG